MKIPFAFRLTLRITFIIFLLIIFFIGYNRFLLDKSLIALDVSLQSLKAGETLGIGLLLNIDNAGEIVKDDFDETRMAKLDYVGSTILVRTAAEDAQIILSNLMGERTKAKANILRTLDISALALRRGIGRTFAFAGGKRQQQLKMSLQKAVDAHRNGNFAKAKDLYTAIIKTGGASRYANIAIVLLTNLDKQLLIKDERDKLTSGLKKLVDADEILRTYFRLGQLETQLLDFDQAGVYFGKILDMAPDLDLATKAKFFLGWANKQAGDFEEGIKYFEELTRESEDEKLILSSRSQIADTFKRKKEYEKAAELFRDLADEYPDSKIAPEALAFSALIYLFDLNDIDRANEIIVGLIKSYPSAALLESTRKELEPVRDLLKHLTKAEKELKDKGVAWSRIPLLVQTLKLAEDAAAWYAVYMIEGSIDRALRGNTQKDEILTIEVDPEFLTNYVRKGMQRVAKAAGVSLSGFKITFPRRDSVRVDGFIKIGPANFKFYVLGKMSLKKHIEMDLIKGEYRPTRWIIFTILEGKLGVFKIPVNIANRILGKAQRIFNQKQIFRIEKFALSREKIYFAGPLRFTQEQLKMERNLLDQYLRIYK